MVKTVPSETEAEIACALLRSVGIKCGYRVPDIASALSSFLGGSQLVLRRACSATSMKTNTKIKLGVVAAAAVAVAGGGVAIAATEPWNPKEEAQAVIDDAAQQLGVAPDALSDALTQALKNRVDDAVAAGRLTEEQGAELKARIDSSEVPIPLGILGPNFWLGDRA